MIDSEFYSWFLGMVQQLNVKIVLLKSMYCKDVKRSHCRFDVEILVVCSALDISGKFNQ